MLQVVEEISQEQILYDNLHTQDIKKENESMGGTRLKFES